MSNIIVTILEKLKLTAPFRNEKSDYILMHDKDSGEVSAVPVNAVLAKVNDRVNAIIYPDGFTKTTPVNRVGNTVTIAPNDFVWRIELNPYTNADEFEQILPATTSPELKRMDTLAATKQGTIVYYPGVEDEFVIRPPDIRTDELRITDLTIFGDEVQEHTEPTVTEIYTLAEKEKLALLDPTADIDKPVSTAQATADAATLTAANDYTDSALDNKVDKDGAKVLSDVNFSTSKDAKLASIDATHYLAPLQTTVQLSALPQASISDKARVYVEDELSDYFYDAAAVSGDIAPDDQAGGVGFWRKVAVGGETAVSIKTKYESNADTNAYTDAEQALVATISGKEVSSNKTGTVVGNEASTSLYLHILGAVTYFQQKLTDSIFGSFINGLTAKTTPVDADSISIVDTEDSNKQKKVTLTNFKAFLAGLFVVKDRLLENATVTGSYNLDYNSYELWNLVLTGATTFTESNLERKAILIRVTGNFALTYPANWSTDITGAYDGTVQNLIVVQYFAAGIYKVQITQPS